MIGAPHDANFLSAQEKIREKLLLFIRSKKLYFCSNHVAVQREVLEFLIPQNPTLETRRWGKDANNDLCIRATQKEGTNTIITATYQSTDVQLTVPYTDFGYIENALHCWLVLLDYVLLR